MTRLTYFRDTQINKDLFFRKSKPEAIRGRKATGPSRLISAVDLGLGLVLSWIVARKVGHAWPLIGAFAAALPDAPGIKDVVEAWPSQVLPHVTWFSPWGIATEAFVTALALYWAIGGNRGLK